MFHVAVRAVILAAICSALLAERAGAEFRPGTLSIQSVVYRDLDGDHDTYPDTGETGRLVLTIMNVGPAIEGVIATIGTDDPDVACLIDWSVLVGDLAEGQVVTLGSLDPGVPGFTFRASDALQSTGQATITLCLRITWNRMFDWRSGFGFPTCFSLPADLDAPAGTQTFIPGPDGVGSTADDGTLLENFDVDRDGDGNFTINDSFRAIDQATGTTVHGSYLRGGAATGTGTVAGVGCGGFLTPAEGNTRCVLDPDYPMDWHLHCPPGATNCPNLETGTCVGDCSYATNDGARATSPPNSLHMAAHWNVGGSNRDVTHLRTIQGFVSAPMNLAGRPRPGDLQLSFMQIVRLIDNDYQGAGFVWGQCFDCAQLQVQIDTDPAPDVDQWGFWDVLVPFQNVYDHKPAASSSTAANYCGFTPTDTGASPPSPNGAHETLCTPNGVWSSCGHPWGTTADQTRGCAGPGVVDPSGIGVWVETRFDLAGYMGQRVRIRWIAETWTFDAGLSSYFEAGPGWSTSQGDDGWWLDDIKATGLITSQMVPAPDTRPAPGTTCPASLCGDADGDGYGSPAVPPCPPGIPVDCFDANPYTYPGAIEVNDGEDNQCQSEPGFGLVDEVTAVYPYWDGPYLSWSYQPLTTSYQVAMSSRGDHSGDCMVRTSPFPDLETPEVPPVGTVYYYLIRALTPHTGSWGANSAGVERTAICGL
jgi:hypothetical protein